MSTYNGYTNYETWNVVLWIENEEYSYEHWRDSARLAWDDAQGTSNPSREARATLQNEIKDYHHENAPDCPGTYGDLLNAALSEVDWWEVADVILDGLELDGYERRAA